MPQLYFSNPHTNALCAVNYHLASNGRLLRSKSVSATFGPIAASDAPSSNRTESAKSVVRSFIPICQAFPAFHALNKVAGDEFLTLIEILDDYSEILHDISIRLQVMWSLLYALTTNDNKLVYQSPELFQKQVNSCLELVAALLLAETTSEVPGLVVVKNDWIRNTFLPALTEMIYASAANTTSADALKKKLPNYIRQIFDPLLASRQDGKLIMPLLDTKPMSFPDSKPPKELIMDIVGNFIGADLELVKPYVIFALKGFYGILPKLVVVLWIDKGWQTLKTNARAIDPAAPKWLEQYLEKKYFLEKDAVKNTLLLFRKIIEESARNTSPISAKSPTGACISTIAHLPPAAFEWPPVPGAANFDDELV